MQDAWQEGKKGGWEKNRKGWEREEQSVEEMVGGVREGIKVESKR